MCPNDSVVLTVEGTEVGDTITWTVGSTVSSTNNTAFTFNAVDYAFSSGVTVTVTVTPNGSTCQAQVSKFFQEIVFDAGTIETVATEYCSTDTPSDITSASDASTSTLGTSIAYRWEQTTGDPSNPTNFVPAGQTTKDFSFTTGPLDVTTHYRRVAIGSLGGEECEEVSNVITINISKAYSENDLNLESSGGEVICEDDSITLTVSGKNGFSISNDDNIQWRIGEDTFINTNNTSYVLSTLQFASTVTVTVKVTPNGSNCGAEQSIFIQKIDIDPGEITTNPLIYCSNITPNPITEVTGATTTTIGTQITYYWESTTQAAGDFNTDATIQYLTTTSTTFTFTTPLLQTTYFRRVAKGSLGGKDCDEKATDPVKIEIESVSGGTFAVNTQYSCSLQETELVLTLTDSNVSSSLNYQWQSSITDKVSTSFANIPLATAATYEVSIATTQTTYFRRVTTSGVVGGCQAEAYMSDIFSYIVNEVDPGTLTDLSSGYYCYGSFPQEIIGTAVAGDPQYQWYVNYQTTPSENNWTAIDGATSQSYQPPPLINSDTNYRRGVVLNDNTNTNCETFTAPVQFDVLDNLDYGYIGPSSGQSQIYCAGEVHPNLELLGITPELKGQINRGGFNQTESNPKIEWYVSNDRVSWSLVTEPNTEGIPTTLNRNNGLSDKENLTETLYYKAKLIYRDDGVSNTNYSQDFDNNATTSVTLNHTTIESIALFQDNPSAQFLDDGEEYNFIATSADGQTSNSVTVTTAVNSTTDQVGLALSNQINSLTGIGATYYPDENIITISNPNSKVISLGSSPTVVSLNIYLLSQTNNSKLCTTFTDIYTLEVEPMPELKLGTGVPENQVVCGDESIQDITVIYSGDVEHFYFSTLPGGLISDTTVEGQVTITGKPTEGGTITFNIESNCSGGDQELTYSIRVEDDPPGISGIFKDFDDPGYKVFYEDGDEIGYNNSICINTQATVTNETSFFACFDETSFTYASLEWEFIPVLASTYSPVISTQVSRAQDGTNSINRNDNAEIGITVEWNKDFVSEGNQVGKWVNVKVRSISDCSSSTKSDWFEQKVWLVNFSETTTNSQTIPDLPEVTVPRPNITNECLGYQYYQQIDIPTCELIPLSNIYTRYTQFYSQATGTTTNDFSKIDWIIESEVEADADVNDAGIIDDIGRVTWNTGFTGRFRVGARAESCSSSANPNNEYVYTEYYDIDQIEKVMPTITVTDTLSCPTPASGTVSTVLDSSERVNWYIDTTNYVDQTHTATSTGELFQNYIGVEGDTDNPDRRLTINWSNNVSGTIKIKAVPKGCAGASQYNEFVRNYEIYAPEAPKLRTALANKGSTEITICENDLNFTPILFDKVGGEAATGYNITNVSTGNTSYTTYIKTTEIINSQVVSITFRQNVKSNRYRTFRYIITLNNQDFIYDGTAVEESYDLIIANLSTVINADGKYTARVVNNILEIVGKPGHFFNVIDNSPVGNSPIISVSSSNYYNQYEISKLQQALPPGTYVFDFGLNVDDGCEDKSNVVLNITVESNVSVSPVDPDNNSIEVCFNENFDDITYLVTGLDSPNKAFTTGLLPSNVTENFINNGSALSSVLTLTFNGITEYWNTRTFEYGIETEGDSCDDAKEEGFQIKVYPNTFIRPKGHYPDGDNEVVNVQQTVCSGSAISAITYEYWGAAGIDVTDNFDAVDILGLELTKSTQPQIAKIGFDINGGQTGNDTQFYSIYIDDTEYRHPAVRTETTTDVLNGLRALLNLGAQVTASVVTNSSLIITGNTNGSTFALEGTTSSDAVFKFGEPLMIQAPNLVTVTGTPTIEDVDDSFATATSTKTTYYFNLTANAPNCGNNSQTATYTLNISPRPRLQKIIADGYSICDGGNSDTVIPFNYKAAQTIDLSIEANGLTIPLDQIILDTNSTSYGYTITRNANVTETTTFTYTATATSAFSCSGTPLTAVVTGTYVIIPHYLDYISPTNLMSQTLCVGSEIKPIEFDYSATYSTPRIQWGTNGNPGSFALTTSGTTLTLSGTLDPASTITQTTAYDFTIILEGSADADSDCFTFEESGVFTVLIPPTIKLSTESSTADQVLCSGEIPSKITYTIEGAGSEAINPTWKANGVPIDEPSWITYPNEPAGTFSILSLPISTSVDVITVYEYELTTKAVNVGGFLCQEDTIIGYITLFPDAELVRTDYLGTAEVCEGDFFEKNVYFKGVTSATVSPAISPLNLTSTVSYTTRQSFTLQVSGTASAGQTNTIQILNGDKNKALVEEIFTYPATPSTSAQTSSNIAAGFKSLIENRSPSQFEVTNTGSVLTVTSAKNTKLFGLRFLTSDAVTIQVVSSTTIEGFISLTATLTTDIVTSTSIYPIVFDVENASCSSDTLDFNLTVNPFEEISSSGGLLNQTICHGSAITPINFSGGSNYEVSWSPSQPLGIIPPNGNLVSTTFQMSGLHSNTSSSITTYTYTVSLIDTADNCISSDVVTGTLTFYPEELLSISSGTSSQTLCTGVEITPIVYDLSKGFNTSNYEVGWSSALTPEGLSFVHSQTAETLTLSGSVPSSLTTLTVYSYTVTLTSEYSCTSTVTTGQLTVNPEQTLTLSSAIATTDQIICEATAIETIVYEFGNGATELDTMGIESLGLDVAIANNTISISGTPTVDVDVPTTYTYTISTVDAYCTPKQEKGYISLLPTPETYFTDLAVPGIKSQEISICNGTEIDEVSISFRNTPSLDVINPDIPVSAEELNISQPQITQRQETTIEITGTSSAVGEIYSVIVKEVGSLDEAFIYKTTLADRSAEQLAQGILEVINNDSNTSYEATRDRSVLTLFNTISSTVYTTKVIAQGNASLSATTTNPVEGFYLIGGTINLNDGLVTETTSYTIDFNTIGTKCNNDSIELIYYVSPLEDLSSSGGLLNQSICYGDPIDPISLTGADRYEISWSPSSPISISPSDAQIISSTFDISGTHLNTSGATTSYTYTISIMGSGDRCTSSNTVTGTLTFYPQELLSISSGSSSLTICTGGEITPIVYDLSRGFNTSNFEVDWSTAQAPAGLSFVHSQTAETLTLSGSVPSSVTTETVYTYTVTLTSQYSCTNTSTTGQITIKPEQTLNLSSPIATTDQIICESTSITTITYEFGNGATSAVPSGLPLGLDIAIENNLISISGTPTVDVDVPTTYTYSISTVDEYCVPKVEIGYITLLPAPEAYFTDAAVQGIRSQEISICNGSTINDLSISFTNTPGLEINDSDIPAGTDNLSFTQSITQRQETTIEITGTSSSVGEIYKIIVKEIGANDKAFSYTTTLTNRSAEQIAQGLFDVIDNDSNTPFEAAVDGSSISLFNTTSSTVFSTKIISVGEASMSISNSQPVKGVYLITGTVSLSSTITSFTLDFKTSDDSNSLVCDQDELSVKFILFDAPSVNVSEDTARYNYAVCDGTTVTLDFEYAGEQTSISAADITWSPVNPGFDLVSQIGTNSFTLSGEINTTVTQTTTYNYTIRTNGSTCDDIEFEGSIDLLPQQLLTYVDGSVEYFGSNTSSDGNESQTICDATDIVPIVYHLEGGSVSHTLTWTTSAPGGISVEKLPLPGGGYSLTISGTVDTNVTSETSYEYTFETIGANCVSNSRVGVINVRPKPFLSLLTPEKNYQLGVNAVCNLDSSEPVIYQFDGSTIRTELSWIGESGIMPGEVVSSINDAVTQETYLFNPSTQSTQTIVYEYSITSISQYGCLPQTVLYGAIEVLPSVTILEDYIRANDITHVSCPGGNDGSIIIPTSPDSEFMKRINGGQNPVAQVVSVALLASNTLVQDDIVRVIIDGTTYSGIVPSDTSTSSIFNELAADILSKNSDVKATVDSNNLVLTSNNPGTSFTVSGVTISSNVTGTTVATTIRENIRIDFDFTWTKNDQQVGNSYDLIGVSAGSYVLSVSINGCATSSATFVIEEPSISYDEVDITCDGLISIPLTIGMTSTQASGIGNLYSAKLYRIENNVFQAVSQNSQLIEERFTPTTLTSTYVLDFNGYVLEPGSEYKVEVRSESCLDLLLEIPVGPITDEIIIQENLIGVTDIQCWGENDGTLTVPDNAVIGGSGTYSYVWSSATGIEYYFKDVFNAPPGSYTLTVFDNINDCEKTTTNVFVVNDKDRLTLTNQSSDLVNECVDGTNGFIQIAGVPQGYDIRWEFVPSVSSQTFELTGAASDFQFFAADQIPNGYSTTGVYTYYLYEGGLGSSCAVNGDSITITGPSPLSLSSSLTLTNVSCGGEEDGTIEFTATGGVAPYFYSIDGGTPSNAFTSGDSTLIEDLGPGTYDLVIGDSTPENCTPNLFTTQVTLTEPPEIIIQENLIGATDIQCWGENDGTLTVPDSAITGGSGTYTYVWTSASGIEYYFKDIFNAPPGSYTLTVFDSVNNCKKTTTNVFVINDKDSVTLTDQSSDLVNQCVDGTNGFIQIAGVPQGFDVKWEFVPSVSSQTFELTGAASDFQFFAADQIPNGYSTTGVYTYYLYEGGLGSSCAVGGDSITISGPSPLSLSSSLTFANITCAGQENGTIQFTASGGVAPYFYSIDGGSPSSPFSSGNTTYIDGLGPGTYDLVIGDSTPEDCTPNIFTTQVILTEPAGGPLELTEGEITPIPCQTSGSGSFQINVTGGSTEKVVEDEIITNSVYQVFVTANAGNFKLNTSFDKAEGGILIENIVTPGNYSVTVTDGSGNCSQEITISIDLEVSESLSALAEATNSSDCSNNDLDSAGGSIQITQFLKGNGEISGYPLWQKQSTVNKDSFVISLSGSIDTFDLSSIGVSIGGTVSQTITASTTESVTINSLADVASILVDNINALPNFNATLSGSSVTVKSPIIDSVSELASSSSSINLSVSSIAQIAESVWVDIQGVAGLEKIENLQAGIYRGIIKDTSGCGAGLVQNSAGGNIFRIDDPQTLQIEDVEFEEITCLSPSSSLEFKLSNGSYTLVPDSNIYELNLNSNILKSTLDSGVSFSSSGAASTATPTSTATSTSTTSSGGSAAAITGNYYTPNFSNNTITIDNLSTGDYELTVRNTQTDCSVILNFSLEEPPSIGYTGETDFIIEPCYEKYEDPFFDPTLIQGGIPFVNLAGETYYSLAWKFFPVDTNQSIVNINSLSNSINFDPSPGRYELIIRDVNGCSIIDDSGVPIPVEFNFRKELANLVVSGSGGVNGDELAQPVSCEIDAEDGKINIQVASSDPNNPVIPPYTIQWHKQAPTNTAYEQKLLIQGAQAGDSLENYTIRLNQIPITYITQIANEPKESVVNELAQQIDVSNQFEARVNPENTDEIIIRTESLALLEMEIISRSTKLQLIKSTSNIATWVPLDGTNGNPNYTGFLDLSDLSEGLYRYTITTSNLTQCENGAVPNSIQDVVIVENENILEIREGPIIDEYLCNGQSGTLFLDVFDGDTGPLTFFYNGTPVTFEQVGTNQYLINIDSPEEIANLEIYNAANCGLSREINIGNGTPLFDFTSINFQQNETFLAREDITFTDNSENEYDTFEFLFGDGTKTDLIDRNTPEPITHEYAIAGTYYVSLRIFNDLGCVEELTKTIKIGKGYSILLPNVFTPNGDIWNSNFRPIFNGLSQITLRIYDSQGGIVYQEEGVEGKTGLELEGWNGNVELSSSDGFGYTVGEGSNSDTNTQLPSSPYFIYTITGRTIDDEPVFRDGTFILLQ